MVRTDCVKAALSATPSTCLEAKANNQRRVFANCGCNAYPVVRNIYETVRMKPPGISTRHEMKAAGRTSGRNGNILLSHTRNQRNQSAGDHARHPESAGNNGDPEQPRRRVCAESRNDRHGQEGTCCHRDRKPVVFSGMSHPSASRYGAQSERNL